MLVGFAGPVGGALAVSLWEVPSGREVALDPEEPARLPWGLVYAGIAAYFFLIIGIAGFIQRSA